MNLKSFMISTALVGLGIVIGMSAQRATAEPAQQPMVYELRTYFTLPGRLPNLNARFENHTMRLFEKHGMKNVIYATPADQENKLVYLIGHKSQEAAKASFDAFRQDPEWKAAQADSEKDGKIVDKIESVFLVPTKYSPMK